MIVNLLLAEDGPPFYFIGDPKRLILSLTFEDPGPSPLEFSDLSLIDQKKILIAIRMEHIEADVPYGELVAEYEKLFSKEAPVAPSPPAPTPEPAGAMAPPTQKSTYEEAEGLFQESCKKIVKQKIKDLKVSLKNESDLRKLRTIRDLELKKKSPRVSVVNFINLELRKLQAAIVEEIQNGGNVVEIEAEPPSTKETFVSDVVESEETTVHLTPEVLIGRATK